MICIDLQCLKQLAHKERQSISHQYGSLLRNSTVDRDITEIERELVQGEAHTTRAKSYRSAFNGLDTSVAVSW